MEKKTCVCNLCQIQLQTDWRGELTDGYSLLQAGKCGAENTFFKMGRDASGPRHMCDNCLKGIRSSIELAGGMK